AEVRGQPVDVVVVAVMEQGLLGRGPVWAGGAVEGTGRAVAAGQGLQGGLVADPAGAALLHAELVLELVDGPAGDQVGEQGEQVVAGGPGRRPARPDAPRGDPDRLW